MKSLGRHPGEGASRRMAEEEAVAGGKILASLAFSPGVTPGICLWHDQRDFAGQMKTNNQLIISRLAVLRRH